MIIRASFWTFGPTFSVGQSDVRFAPWISLIRVIIRAGVVCPAVMFERKRAIGIVIEWRNGIFPNTRPGMPKDKWMTRCLHTIWDKLKMHMTG